MGNLKKPLFYALDKRWGNFRVVAVTTYKESTGRWHGRYTRDNEGTHGRGDLYGRFETENAAEAKVRGLEDIKRRHKPLIDAAQRAYQNAQADERREIDKYLGSGS